jgi:hypothetical protein
MRGAEWKQHVGRVSLGAHRARQYFVKGCLQLRSQCPLFGNALCDPSISCDGLLNALALCALKFAIDKGGQQLVRNFHLVSPVSRRQRRASPATNNPRGFLLEQVP